MCRASVDIDICAIVHYIWGAQDLKSSSSSVEKAILATRDGISY